MTDGLRQFVTELEIAAPREAVWRALTEPDELTRWFPLQAEVSPGVGGRMGWSWNGEYTWVSAIDRWDPSLRLRLVQQDQRPLRSPALFTFAPAALVAGERVSIGFGSRRLNGIVELLVSDADLIVWSMSSIEGFSGSEPIGQEAASASTAGWRPTEPTRRPSTGRRTRSVRCWNGRSAPHRRCRLSGRPRGIAVRQ